MGLIFPFESSSFAICSRPANREATAGETICYLHDINCSASICYMASGALLINLRREHTWMPQPKS